MLSLLPDHADPLRLCSLGKAYRGELPLAGMPRLAPLLTSHEGEAAFTLVFRKDSERRAVVDVQVTARLWLQCQRCLQPVSCDVEADSRLAVVGGPEEAERLPDELDPLLVEQGRVVLSSLVEDELILALPAAPRHAPGDCAVKLSDINAGAETARPDDDATSPAANAFAALAALKGDDRDQND